MLKQVLYYLLLATTTVRFVDMIYILAKDSTNLPVPVLVVTTLMILYGIALIVRKFVGNVLLKQLMIFYMIQTVMIVFNLSYIAIACPLRISAAETIVVGTFFDILVNFTALYFCTRHMRSHYFVVTQLSTDRHG